MVLAYKTDSGGNGLTPAQIAAEIALLMQEMQQDATNVTQQEELLQQLIAEKNGPNPPPNIDEQIANQQKAVDAAKSKQSSDDAADQKQILTDEQELSVDAEIASANNSQGDKLLKLAQKSGQQTYNNLVHKTEAEQIEQNTQAIELAYANAKQKAIDNGQDALQRIANIVNDQEDIDADEAEEKELQAQIIEDSIKAAALGPLLIGAYYAVKAAEAGAKLAEVKKDESNTKDDLGVQKDALSKDLAALFAASEAGLNSEIQDLFKGIQTLLQTVFNSGHTEANVQEVSALLAEVMSIVQMIMTKVQQIRSQNDQWISRANASNQEIAANKAKVDEEAMAELQQFSSFMKVVMDVTKYGGMALSVATAVFTGGATMMAFAAMMVVLIETGALDQATGKLADAMAHGAIWAKVMADAMITMAAVMVTHSAGALGSQISQVASNAAQIVSNFTSKVTTQATQQAVSEMEIELTNLARGLEVEMTALSEASTSGMATTANGVDAESAKSMQSFLKQFLNSIKNAGKDLAASVNKQNLGYGLAYFAASNGVVDTAEAITAAATHQANKTKEELEQQELFQILAMCTGLLQAIASFAGTSQAAGNSVGAINKLTQMLEGNLPAIMRICRLLQAGLGLAQAGAAGSLAANDVFKGKLLADIGTADSTTSVYKSLGQMQKLYEQKQIELFASKMQQMIEEVSIMVHKFGQAENEAARILQQSAV